MHQVLTDELAQTAAAHLRKADPVLAPIIERYGPCPIRPHTDYYQELVEAIIGQQLSVKAAASIRAKFVNLYDGTFPSPEQIIETPVEELRGAGFSRAKSLYVHDLAQHMLDGKIDFSHFDSLNNEEIVIELVAVKGIGEWTAHMFLMFCMGRTDILPYGDLGIRSGIQKLYQLETLPDRAGIESIAKQNHWRPYESVAAWYIWQSLDNAPVKA